jgi:hypothetical protein
MRPRLTQRAGAWAALVTALVSVPTLWVGFVGDDLLQRLMLEHRLPGFGDGFWRSYEFTPQSLPTPEQVTRGILPWFTDPELQIRFFRPLTSASLAMDAWCFGRNAVLAHAHSIAWLLLLITMSARLYQRWFEPAPALLSALVFALAGAHGIPTAWLASRHTLIAAALTVGSLWAWAKYREDQWRPGRYLAPYLVIASLLASESALSSVAFLAAYELNARGWRRPGGMLAYLGLGLVYVAWYAAADYGTHASGAYVSPFVSPGRYLSAVLVRVPSLAAELLWALPADAASAGGQVQVALVSAGIVGAAAYTGCLYALRARLPAASRCRLGWLAAATMVSLCTLAGTVPTSRVLPLPLFGSAAIVGHALCLLGDAARRAPWPRRMALAAPLLLFGALHLAFAPFVRVQTALACRAISAAEKQMAETAEVGNCSKQGYLYLLTGADPSVALFAGPALAFYAPQKAGAERFRVLSLAPHPQRLRREAMNVLELEVLAKTPKRGPIQDMLRSAEHPLRPGSQIPLGELRVRTLATGGGTWTRVRFEFQENLDPGRVCLIAWRGGRLEAVTLPDLGETVEIAHEPGPMGM